MAPPIQFLVRPNVACQGSFTLLAGREAYTARVARPGIIAGAALAQSAGPNNIQKVTTPASALRG